jgi:uncharacterized protein
MNDTRAMSRIASWRLLAQSVVLVLVFLCAGGALALEIPPLTGRIVDLADLLDSSQEASLDAELAAHEAKSSDQVVVLTIPALDGEALEDYANKVFRTWAIGQNKENNGVLLLIARDDHKLRIEVGYGLEGTLTDALSSFVINQTIVPKFRSGDFGGGVIDGARDIMTVLSGDAAELEARARRNPVDQASNVDWFAVLFFIMFFSIFVGSIFIPVMVRMFGQKIAPHKYKWLGMIIDTTPGRGGSSGGGGSSGSW